MRPQLGSEAKNAVLTSGELAMVFATSRQSVSGSPSVTSMVMNFVAPSPSRTIAGAARGKQHAGVIRGRVAIHGDAIEGGIGRRSDTSTEGFAGYRGVGCNKGEHCRHVRLDHAGAFLYTVNGDFAATEGDTARRSFRNGIRRHDALRRIAPAVFAQLAHGGGER